MSDETESAHTSSNRSGRDLQSLANVLEDASRQPTRFQMARSGQESLGLPIVGELPEDLPVPERAVAWALAYHVETINAGGRRRVRLAPALEHDDGSDPPQVRDVPTPVIDVWLALLDLVHEAPARARLHHLLFERRGPDTVKHARAAADAYLKSAENWERERDAIQDLTAATRLARAIKDEQLTQTSLERMADLADQQLRATNPAMGTVLRALDHLVGEPNCLNRVDDLLERAVSACPDVNLRDRILAIMLDRCSDDAARAAVWRRRVNVYTKEAEAASSKLMRAKRLQEALERAEDSGDPQLRRETAAHLQTVRHDDLEMTTFTGTSRRYEEQFDRLVATASSGENWRQALVNFALFGPVSGDTDSNRALIEERHRLHPLGALFPTQLLGPDGLPVYTGISEEDRFDVDLVGWEAELIGQWAPVMAAALHEIPRRHGLPTLAEISEFLSQWPGVDENIGPAIARSLLRYWTGDSEGACYTIMPQIETLVRTLVLRANSGIYRLQRERSPGQYVGLGSLLQTLQEEYGLSESYTRFLAALLHHPAGLNLRNQMLHGFVVGNLGPDVTAVVLHAALGIATIQQPNETTRSDTS